MTYIKDYLVSRGVTRLCHLTKLVNLVHILSSCDGILASQNIDPDIIKQNDPLRSDGKPDFVCCSVQYPNAWYLRDVKNRDTDRIFTDWVVIFIDLDILDQRKILFSPCNAATANGRHISGSAIEICKLYADETVSRKREQTLLSCCPTDDQAEILVSDNIPVRFFTGFAVSSEEKAAHLYALLNVNRVGEIPIYISPDLLSTSWSRLAHNGVYPAETLYRVRKEP